MYLSQKGCLAKFESKALEGIFVRYGAKSRTYRIHDKAFGRVIESSSVVFEENDGSQVGQVDMCADDEIPQDAIGRMGVGFFRPIERHLVADREELCSTQVEPSSSQHQQNPAAEANDAPIQGQSVDPPVVEAAIPRADNPAPTSGVSGPMDSTVQPSDGVSPHGDQDQHNDDDAAQGNDQGQDEGQDEDQNDNIDREFLQGLMLRLKLVARQELKEP